MERLDLVIFGASGFTGKYAVEEMMRILPEYPFVTWGIAGRSHKKMKEVLEKAVLKTGGELTDIPIIIADVNDTESLLAMAKKAKVILNCCGPFRFFGEPVVKACIIAKTHHLDVSGEPQFMEEMQLRYNEPAHDAGIYIISACGFDCIPCDLGVIFLEKQFKGTVNSIETYVSMNMSPDSEGSVMNYATFESAVQSFSNRHDLLPLRKNLFPDKLPILKPKLKKRPLLYKNNIDGLWYIPLPGADSSVIYRTQRYFLSTRNKRPVQVHVYIGFVSLHIVFLLIIYALFIPAFLNFDYMRQLILRHPKIFTLGTMSHEEPTEKTTNNLQFNVILNGYGWDETVRDFDKVPPNKTISVKVSGFNPFYGSTCKALILSGITIIKEGHLLPGKGGVLTTGAAFAETSLISQLNKHNIKFEVLPSVKPMAHL